MSQENVEVIRRAIEHLSETGELAPECYDAEVEWTTQPDAPLQTTYRGLSGLQRSLDSVHEAWASMKIEPREFIQTDSFAGTAGSNSTWSKPGRTGCGTARFDASSSTAAAGGPQSRRAVGVGAQREGS
jgi:hypothetical protein